jgi:hypothetical protein
MQPRIGAAAFWLLPVMAFGLVAAVSAGPPAPPRVRLTTAELAARERDIGKDAVGLLLLSGLADEPAARRLRQQALSDMAEQRLTATQAELDMLATRLARALPKVVRSAAEVQELLGTPAQVTRQVLYRRYREQWTFDSPLGLCFVFDCFKGEELSVRTVHPLIIARP